MRQTGRGLAKVRSELRKAIRPYSWNPIGYVKLRRRIMDGEFFDKGLQQPAGYR